MSEQTDEQKVRAKLPGAKLIGPSGDGCHVEANGKWLGYGNIPDNAWADAARRLED